MCYTDLTMKKHPMISSYSLEAYMVNGTAHNQGISEKEGGV